MRGKQKPSNNINNRILGIATREKKVTCMWSSSQDRNRKNTQTSYQLDCKNLRKR